MPNHITNKVKIFAEEKQIRKILKAIQNDEYGIGSIDFDKIIPMPDNIFRGNLGQKESKLYGKDNWYDWSVENWDTKWNAYGHDNFTRYDGGNEIQFLTAWSRPEQVIKKLSQMFPKIQFHHAWADEDIGYNVGEALYQDGEELEYNIPKPDSKEAYRLSSEILGIELSESGLSYENVNDNYEPSSDKDFKFGGMS